MRAHQLARQLLAGPDVDAITLTECCRCSAPLRVDISRITLVTDEAPTEPPAARSSRPMS